MNGGGGGAGSTQEEATIETPWTQPAEEVLEALQVAREKGLSPQEVEARRRRHGANRLREMRTKSAWRILLEALGVTLSRRAPVSSSVSQKVRFSGFNF